jgi:hypothetical protein
MSVFLPPPQIARRKNFHVSATDFCGFMASGGRLASFGALQAVDGVLTDGSLHSALIALGSAQTRTTRTTNGATVNEDPTFLVAIGGAQNPNAVNGGKGANWAWLDRTNYATINGGQNWAVGEPDDTTNAAATGAGSTGNTGGVDGNVANYLAMGRTNGNFYDVNGDERMDHICQYRAPAPCPPGFKYHLPASTDPASEYGKPSCLRVFPPAPIGRARAECFAHGKQPANPSIKYFHLATFGALVGTMNNPTTNFIKTLAQAEGVDISLTPKFWTGGLLTSTDGVTLQASWVDDRTFDSTYTTVGTLDQVNSGDSLDLVLNFGESGVPRLESFVNVGGEIDEDSGEQLPFVCEIDVAVRIEASTSTGRNFGKLITYAAVTKPEGSTPCKDGFSSFSGHIGCQQAGFDTGRSPASSTTEQTAQGDAPRPMLPVCIGSEDTTYLEDCGNSVQAVPFSQNECTSPYIVQLDCALTDRRVEPGTFPPSSGGGDIVDTSSGMSDSNTAITAVVVVVGAFLIVLAAVYIVKGVRSIKSGGAHSALVSPEKPAPATAESIRPASAV